MHEKLLDVGSTNCFLGTRDLRMLPNFNWN